MFETTIFFPTVNKTKQMATLASSYNNAIFIIYYCNLQLFGLYVPMVIGSIFPLEHKIFLHYVNSAGLLPGFNHETRAK
jgi:hypothetical protein